MPSSIARPIGPDRVPARRLRGPLWGLCVPILLTAACATTLRPLPPMTEMDADGDGRITVLDARKCVIV